ncbi:enoyl-CoA hydratase-related protein, partial [Rhizobium ruizarguesonis]
VISAINGICCGGGLEIALSTDLILSAEHATFALPEIRSGTVAAAWLFSFPNGASLLGEGPCAFQLVLARIEPVDRRKLPLVDLVHG